MKSMVVGFLLLWSTQALAQADLEVTEQADATFGAGDAEAWAALHTDDFVWTIFGDLPQSGRRVGTQSVIDQVLGVFPAHWPALSFETIETFSADRGVCSHPHEGRRHEYRKSAHVSDA